jgi:hypothetical protein
MAKRRAGIVRRGLFLFRELQKTRLKKRMVIRPSAGGEILS